MIDYRSASTESLLAMVLPPDYDFSYLDKVEALFELANRHYSSCVNPGEPDVIPHPVAERRRLGLPPL